MNDVPEIDLAGCSPRLQKALQWLATTIESEWRAADVESLRSQKRHKILARIAIAAGTLSIVIAIVQLAITATPPPHVTIVPLEVLAFVAAVLSVGIGIFAGLNRRWLGHRHRAERLRMLKFRALERLLVSDEESWKSWIEQELHSLPAADEFHRIEEWSTEGEVEPPPTEMPGAFLDSDFTRAIMSYYLVKRLGSQADYFQRRHREFESQARGWRSLALPFFLGSVICVVAHFLTDWTATRTRDEDILRALEITSVWFIAMAAILPVLAAGARAWMGAFEIPRSASLFGAKHFALARAAKQIAQDMDNAQAVQRHIGQIEHFLENEHREWLRLLRDTEWYL